jgi:hypothetical protein
MILRPANAFDVGYISDHLRLADKRELAASQPGVPFRQIVKAAAESSVICETIANGSRSFGGPVGLWGVVPTPEFGSIWLVSTDHLESISLSFLRACRPAIARAHALFPTLACASHRDNTLHLNWLQWLGFTANDVGHPHFIPHTRHV